MNKHVENIECNDGSIHGTITDHTPYYTANNNLPMDGVLRTNCGGLEYYDADAHCWLPYPGSEVKLEISCHYQDVLNWAMDKMFKEQKELALMEKYPALKTAKQNYETVKAIVENEVD